MYKCGFNVYFLLDETIQDETNCGGNNKTRQDNIGLDIVVCDVTATTVTSSLFDFDLTLQNMKKTKHFVHCFLFLSSIIQRQSIVIFCLWIFDSEINGDQNDDDGDEL